MVLEGSLRAVGAVGNPVPATPETFDGKVGVISGSVIKYTKRIGLSNRWNKRFLHFLILDLQ